MSYIPPEVVEWWSGNRDLRNSWTGVLNGNPHHPATHENIIDVFHRTFANKEGVIVDKKTVVFLWPGIRLNGWAAQYYRNNIESTSINHGLSNISAMVKKMEYKTYLIDLRRCHGWEEVEALFTKMEPFALCVGFHTIDEEVALKAIELFKKCQPKVPIIVGGVHVSVVRKPIPGCTTVFGEGDITIIDLIHMIEDGEKLPETIEGQTVENLDGLPFTDRSLFNQRAENDNPFLPGLPKPFVTINFGRGCYFKRCAFCHESHINTPKYRVRSPEMCITEISRLNPGSIMIHDDIFPPAKWCHEFVYLWKERIGRRIPFWCQMRADFIVRNEGLIKDLSEIGLTWVSLGVESGSQRILDFLDKGTTVEENYKAIKILQDNNVNIFCNLIFAVPTETKEDVEATAKLIRDTRPTSLSMSTYTNYPNSQLYKYCIDNDLFLDEQYASSHSPYQRKVKGIDYTWLFSKIGELSPLHGDFISYSGPDIFPEKPKSVKVTCITLSHDRPKLLSVAFKSIQAQTLKDYEYLVLDESASTPEMDSILAEIEADPHCRVIKVHDTRLSRLWNQGIDIARGEYICLLDDDNWKEPTFMEQMAKKLDEDSGIDAVACSFIAVDEVRGLAGKSDPDLRMLKEYNTIDGGSFMFRKSVTERLGWFDERINTQEDWDFVLRLQYQSNGFGIVNQPLTTYRIHKDNRMLVKEQLGEARDRQFMLTKKYDRPFRVHVYIDHYGRMTQSQKDVIDGIESAVHHIPGIEVVESNQDLTIVPGPFMVPYNFDVPILPIHMEDPYATTNINFAKENKDHIVALVTNEIGFVKTYDDILGAGKTIFCPILGVNDVKIDLHAEPKERDIDILFLGYPYPSRAAVGQDVYKAFAISRKVLFVGDRWDEYVGKEFCHPTTDDKGAMDLMRRAKIVVVSERVPGDLGDQETDTWHRGYFESASGAAVVLYCPRGKHHNFKNTVSTFSTVRDLIYGIDFLLKNPDELSRMSRLAFDRAINNYTYRIRMRKILQAVRSQRFFYQVD
jgi:radical SAM superfamily enzyme YgiQ (UPF0313 family)/glycosyltransferase involved in cell wall biosynthesis